MKIKASLIIVLFLLSAITREIEAAPKNSTIDPSYIRDFDDIGKELSAELNESKGELTISKWDNEVYFKIRTAEIPITSNLNDGKTVLEYQDYEARIYTVKEGIEFDIILDTKPKTNVFTFNISSDNLIFYYQPPMNEEVWPKTWSANETHVLDENGTVRRYRPNNIVGSYAVYHESKRGNEYTTGKVFHIYRPKIIDNQGVEIWGELNISDDYLTISIPSSFLSNAEYPIRIDPTFGKTDVGGTNVGNTVRNRLWVSEYSVAEPGIATNISVYVSNQAGGLIQAGMYDGNTTIPINWVFNTSAQGVVGNSWNNFTVNNEAFSSGIYWIGAIWDTNGITLRYDNVGDRERTGAITFGQAWPDPWPGVQAPGTEALSVFITYSQIGSTISNDNLVSNETEVDDLESFSLNVTVSMTPDTGNFSRNILTIDPESLAINITYLNGTGFSELEDPSDYISLNVGASTKDDISSTSFNLTYVLFIRPTITREGLFNVTSFSNETQGVNASDLFTDVFNLTIRRPPEPDLLYGAGFNASSPVIELRWNVTSPLITDFEIQNSADGAAFTFLDNTTIQSYNDTTVTNGTYIYYRVRARRITGVGLKNSTFSNIDLEQVYFIRGLAGITTQNITGEWILYNASAINASIGTVDAGNLASTFFIDGNQFNVSEVVGVPGQRLSINFTLVDPDADCLWIVIYYLYDGNLNHLFNIEVWNFTSSAWVQDGLLVDGLVFSWVNSTIYGLRIPIEFLSSGEIRIRLNHASPGNINHDLSIDLIQLQAFIPAAAPAEVFQFFWIVIAIALMLIGIVLSKMWFEEGDP